MVKVCKDIIHEFGQLNFYKDEKTDDLNIE